MTSLLPNYLIAASYAGRSWGGVPLDSAHELDAALSKARGYEEKGYAEVTIYARLPGGFT